MKQPFSRTSARIRVGFLAATALVAATTLSVSHLVFAKEPPSHSRKVNVVVSDSPLARDGKHVASFAPVVKRVAASVVKVNVSTKAKIVPMAQSPFGDNEMFRRFFGEQGGTGGMRTPAQHGLGSGVIITEDGYILTNNHVVDGADEIKVALNDGREFTAKVVGRDPRTEVAVIKIEAKNLPVVTLADSDKIEVGDVCLAIGNPFGVGQTVTMGIVSATGRVGVGLDYEDFIQTDAAINPGNSGGALIDAEGRLIGINTLILSRSGGYQGIGFAIPSNLARSVMTSLIDNGTVVRGYLGVGLQEINAALVKKFKLENDEGVLIRQVEPRSPADKAGIKDGDVVLSFNDKKVKDPSHLKLLVAETAPGTKVPVDLLRDGERITLKVTVKEQPGAKESASAQTTDENSNESLKGVGVADLDSATRSQYGVPANIHGAVVTTVEQDSVAFESGLRPGDVILEINRKAVKGAEDAVHLTENLKDKTILLKVWSRQNGNAGTHFLVVDESKAG